MEDEVLENVIEAYRVEAKADEIRLFCFNG